MDSGACNYNADAEVDDASCTYPAHANFDCDGNCNNDADGDGICDELEGLIPELETACGIGTMWDAELGQCVFDVECARVTSTSTGPSPRGPAPDARQLRQLVPRLRPDAGE